MITTHSHDIVIASALP